MYLIQNVLPLYAENSKLIDHNQENSFLVHWQHFLVPEEKREAAVFNKTAGFSLYLADDEENYPATYYRYLHQLVRYFEKIDFTTETPTESPDQLLKVVAHKIDEFNGIITKKRLYRLFWDGDVARDEKDIQELYYSHLSIALKQLGIEINRERDTGIGPVDYIIQKGLKDNMIKAFVEMKLSHGEWKKGIEKQLISYMQHGDCKDAIYFCIHYGDEYIHNKQKNKRSDFINEEVARAIKKYPSDHNVSYKLFDVSKKPSASKM